MPEDKIVQFVFFETILESSEFINEWERFVRSENRDVKVTLQQTPAKNGFKYIAQHYSAADEFSFVFFRPKRSAKVAEVEIRAKKAGGYILIQEQQLKKTKSDEYKVFVFLTDRPQDFSTYNLLMPDAKLNIYEAYYENCQYTCILEFFVKNSAVDDLRERLKQTTLAETGTYTECVLQTT
jgi:hypothetical protein